MPRNMSFAKTTQQIGERTKDVTRRLGWRNLKAGERLNACVKCQGLKPGEAIERLALIEVVSVRRERLDAIDQDDVRREGFPDMTPTQFVEMFCRDIGATAETDVARIEFKYVDDPAARIVTPKPERAAAPAGRSFRSPRVGDVIECVTPTKTWTPLFPAGSILRAELTTAEGAAHAATLVASRRWCVVEDRGA